jgi:fructokinase
MSLLVVGEALIDIVADRRRSSLIETEHTGGAPANVALGLARLGRPVELLTAIGSDARGRKIASHLESAGVTIRSSSWSNTRTPTARAELLGDGSARYQFDIQWALRGDVDLDGVVALHTGSIGAFLEPGATSILQAVREAARRGVFVTLDPNIRSALIGDQDSARHTFTDLAGSAHVVKLSDEDATWLFECGIDDAIDRILLLGPRLVVVTAGASGSTLSTRTNRVTTAARPVVVADTIGAGDSFMSMLITETLEVVASAPIGADEHDRYACLDRLDSGILLRIGRRCATASAITVSRAGANPPTMEDVEALEM